jgi:hypothetical protein
MANPVWAVEKRDFKLICFSESPKLLASIAALLLKTEQKPRIRHCVKRNDDPPSWFVNSFWHVSSNDKKGYKTLLKCLSGTHPLNKEKVKMLVEENDNLLIVSTIIRLKLVFEQKEKSINYSLEYDLNEIKNAVDYIFSDIKTNLINAAIIAVRVPPNNNDLYDVLTDQIIKRLPVSAPIEKGMAVDKKLKTTCLVSIVFVMDNYEEIGDD